MAQNLCLALPLLVTNKAVQTFGFLMTMVLQCGRRSFSLVTCVEELSADGQKTSSVIGKYFVFLIDV